jgi:DNA-binding NarL/FixJ family response regulator
VLRVAIIDPQPAVRAGLAVLLRSEPGLVAVGGAGSEEEGLALLARRRVDVVVVDPELLGPDGLPYCRRLKALERPPRVVVYTAAAAEPAYAMGAGIAGADAVVDKRESPRRLFEAIRRSGRSAGVLPALEHAA